MDKDGREAAILFVFLGAVTLPIADVFWEGFVLMTLWGWFIVPQFHLPALNLAVAIGMTCTAGLLTHQYVPSKENDSKSIIAHTFLFPAMMLAIGWFAK